MPKNVQTTAQLHSAHMVKFSKQGSNRMWSMNFQMFKLDLEKEKIKLPTSVGSLKKQEISRKTTTSALLTTPNPLTLWITTNWKILKEIGIPDHLTCLLGNPYAGQETTVRTGHGTTDWFHLGKEYLKAVYWNPVCLIYRQSQSASQLSHSVVSDSSQPHGLQHARPPCLSPTPRVCSDSCPLISNAINNLILCHPSSSCLQSFPPSGLFPMNQLLASSGQSIEFQLQHQSFQWTLRTLL